MNSDTPPMDDVFTSFIDAPQLPESIAGVDDPEQRFINELVRCALDKHPHSMHLEEFRSMDVATDQQFSHRIYVCLNEHRLEAHGFIDDHKIVIAQMVRVFGKAIDQTAAVTRQRESERLLVVYAQASRDKKQEVMDALWPVLTVEEQCAVDPKRARALGWVDPLTLTPETPFAPE